MNLEGAEAYQEFIVAIFMERTLEYSISNNDNVKNT